MCLVSRYILFSIIAQNSTIQLLLYIKMLCNWRQNIIYKKDNFYFILTCVVNVVEPSASRSDGSFEKWRCEVWYPRQTHYLPMPKHLRRTTLRERLQLGGEQVELALSEQGLTRNVRVLSFVLRYYLGSLGYKGNFFPITHRFFVPYQHGLP